MPTLPVVGTVGSDDWIFVGQVSSFPEVRTGRASITDGVKLRLTAEDGEYPDCKILEILLDKDSNITMQATELVAADAVPVAESSKSQVLVFRHRGRVHAVDNQCPHQSYPLCRGELHDIEDFGIILSAAITCPKHGWAFDLTTGESSRGRYQLPIWDVDVRNAIDLADDGEWGQNGTIGSHSGGNAMDRREVWIRKRR